MNLERAIANAVEAHTGQCDKAGAPYILHPLRVMFSLQTDVERITGVLHDVVEDGPGWTFERLEAEGFSPEVLTPLRLVTKTPDDAGDDLNAYLRFGGRCRAHPVARRVKMADIKDNLDLTRLAQFTDRERLRVSKYLAAVRLLEATPG